MAENIGVYQIELNGKRYIGSSVNLKKRWSEHLYSLRKGIHKNKHLQNAYNKYGEDALVFSILEVVETPEEVIQLEQKYLDELKPEYNLSPTAGSSLGRIISIETRQKLRGYAAWNKGKHHTKESKQKMREIHLGKKLTEETKQKLRESLIGNNNALGFKHGEEFRRKMSEIRLGKHLSEETKQKLREYKPTDETRQKLREAGLGKHSTEEIRRKLSNIAKGRKASEETRQKLREIGKGNTNGKGHTPWNKDKVINVQCR